MTATEISKAASDVFRKRGLGAGGHLVYCVLLNHGQATPRQVMELTGAKEQTTRDRFHRLQEAGLARREGSEWAAVHLDDAEWHLLADALGVAGLSDNQRLRHELDRVGGTRSQKPTVALATRRLDRKVHKSRRRKQRQGATDNGAGVAATGTH
jgi:hypothetical protein